MDRRWTMPFRRSGVTALRPATPQRNDLLSSMSSSRRLKSLVELVAKAIPLAKDLIAPRGERKRPSHALGQCPHLFQGNASILTGRRNDVTEPLTDWPPPQL